MIKKVLIANRGEIVRRIIRTCSEMGIETVAIYSDADKDAEYLSEATESYYVGKSAPVKSYLNVEMLIKAIQDTGADAVHPGYGFLSESADFATAVEKAGAKWIGPAPRILNDIESKCYCRNLASSIGVPVTPGTIQPITGIREIYETAGKVGLPILLKLDKGGGGKGIQKIDSFESEEITQAQLESMQRIGEMAFASSDVYVEKAVLNPRHIEVQFIADEHGNVVCLGERECSIQRRYQKIIEESPSAIVNSQDRQKLYERTVKLIQTMKYAGAGTVEYLRAQDGSFYFMEINARLQVEHPVTEAVTGLDLVRLQLQVANGEVLPITQDDGDPMGYIELRKVIVEQLMKPKGVDCNVDNVLVTTGGLETMNLICQIFINPGDVILVESPTFVHCVEIFEMFQAKCVPMEMDEQGIVIADVEKKIKELHPKMIYVVPTFQNPSGKTLPADRRQALAQLAGKYDVILLEDDPYRDIRYSGEEQPPIKTFDKTGNVVMANSFSKIFSPGSRLGYVVASKELIELFYQMQTATVSVTSTISQVICAEFFKRGYYPAHHRMICDMYRERRDVMMNCFDRYFPKEVEHTFPDGGMFTWVTCPDSIDTTQLLAQANQNGVAYVAGEGFFVEGYGKGRNCMRMSFTGVTPENIEIGMERLGRLITSKLRS